METTATHTTNTKSDVSEIGDRTSMMAYWQNSEIFEAVLLRDFIMTVHCQWRVAIDGIHE